MFGFIKKTIKFFSRFTDELEKECYGFFVSLKPKSDKAWAQKRATYLMGKSMAKCMMILEWKFKGYTQLTKKYRQIGYDNLKIIEQDFFDSCQNQNFDSEQNFLEDISRYLSPQTILEYRSGSSFDKLLKNPKKEKLVGDCNQITSLYIHLFSLKFDISSLQLKLLPGHVCLHHKGIDYETTSGQITKYQEFERITPISEMIAINVLDTTDNQNSQHSLPTENRLECAELACVFSSNQKIAEQNLDTAYRNMAIKKMNAKNFSSAANWASKTKDKSFLDVVLHNQAVYELNKKHYSTARKLFYRLHDNQGISSTDRSELNNLVVKLKGCKTMQDYKYKKNIIYQIKKLAIKLHDHDMQKFCTDILKQV